ncbi:hypothetical protein E9S_09129 [Moraxella catarrhalis BC7]|nr:hypothetical protein E9S_09129 [Moraxella catarrhalis BC7]
MLLRKNKIAAIKKVVLHFWNEWLGITYHNDFMIKNQAACKVDLKIG